MTPPRAAVSVIVFRDDTVLLVLRGRPPAEGLWAPVGGRVEPGETAEEAALREVREETGIDARLVGPCGRRRVEVAAAEGGIVVWDILVFAALWQDGEPVAGDDAAAAKFVALDRLEGSTLVEGGPEAVLSARALLDGSHRADGVRKP